LIDVASAIRSTPTAGGDAGLSSFRISGTEPWWPVLRRIRTVTTPKNLDFNFLISFTDGLDKVAVLN